ncbi:polysaccharide deacetylase family protein [Parabacteroides bouchesdurhonensis]|uniref:polysaccharide deacetylase family protein n=1 Tax=Parabacteroides bouchesdurhonensis TaxID=1936995 RepID=UPI000C82451A|nr:polysaccharide deacetylase family protein [Parabacteroides bouchesdurhonensis]
MSPEVLYIISFLIGGDKAETFGSLVGYTSDQNKFSRYKVVIIPSPFFKDNVYGTPASIPALPLREIEGVPLLFGSPKMEWYGDTWVVHADIIASAYFLLTRYEEIRRRDVRDIHGRFPGKESLPYKAGFIHRPIVDEYGKLLRRWLRQTRIPIPEPEANISKIWLTHDVDAPFYCRTFRSFIREAVKGEGLVKAWEYYNAPLTSDPFYTFPWLIEQDNSVKNAIGKEHCESLFFFKAGGTTKYDKPKYNLHSKDMKALLHLCKTGHCLIGLHSSYEAGITPSLIRQEKDILRKVTGQPILYNRHHYLCSHEPEDMDWLEKAGITDDFTMGYADVSGFRLGTCRPVLWINPINKRISSLTLHPLNIMDCSLSEPQYMGMGYEEALVYCLQIAEQVRLVNGELVLLWHNSTVSLSGKSPVSANWHRELYAQIVREIKTLTINN